MVAMVTSNLDATLLIDVGVPKDCTRIIRDVKDLFWTDNYQHTLYGDGIHMVSFFVIISNIYHYRLMFMEQKCVYD